MSHASTIRLHPEDDVEIALADLRPGAVTASGVTVTEPVPRGHKVAARTIPVTGE